MVRFDVDVKGGAGRSVASHVTTDSIRRLDDVPSTWWKKVPNDRSGYQYCTKTYVLGTATPTLLDTGAGVNTIRGGCRGDDQRGQEHGPPRRPRGLPHLAV